MRHAEWIQGIEVRHTPTLSLHSIREVIYEVLLCNKRV